MKINKEIYSIKMFITTDCNQRCRYCFVNKDRKYMDYNTARNAIDYLISSSGKNKALKLYGGEPLLNFALMKKIIPYAFNRAKIENKDLTIGVCTNGVILNREHVNFFKRHKFRIGISIDGKKDIHESFRGFGQHKGCFDIVKRNVPLLLKNIDKENLDVELTVTSSTANSLYKNFRYMLDLGFDTLCIAPAVCFQTWTAKAKEAFFINMMKIRHYILEEVKKGNFIYILTLNQEIVNGILSKMEIGLCHFYRSLEILPKGDMGFSAFLMNIPDRSRYIIGNINKDINKQYKHCEFKAKSIECKLCISKYFGSKLSSSMDIYKIRNRIFKNMADTIFRFSKSNTLFRRYIKGAKEHIYF